MTKATLHINWYFCKKPKTISKNGRRCQTQVSEVSLSISSWLIQKWAMTWSMSGAEDG